MIISIRGVTRPWTHERTRSEPKDRADGHRAGDVARGCPVVTRGGVAGRRAGGGAHGDGRTTCLAGAGRGRRADAPGRAARIRTTSASLVTRSPRRGPGRRHGHTGASRRPWAGDLRGHRRGAGSGVRRTVRDRLTTPADHLRAGPPGRPARTGGHGGRAGGDAVAGLVPLPRELPALGTAAWRGLSRSPVAAARLDTPPRSVTPAPAPRDAAGSASPAGHTGCVGPADSAGRRGSGRARGRSGRGRYRCGVDGGGTGGATAGWRRARDAQEAPEDSAAPGQAPRSAMDTAAWVMRSGSSAAPSSIRRTAASTMPCNSIAVSRGSS